MRECSSDSFESKSFKNQASTYTNEGNSHLKGLGLEARAVEQTQE